MKKEINSPKPIRLLHCWNVCSRGTEHCMFIIKCDVPVSTDGLLPHMVCGCSCRTVATMGSQGLETWGHKGSGKG